MTPTTVVLARSVRIPGTFFSPAVTQIYPDMVAGRQTDSE